MFLRHLDLTTALRPHLYDDETLLFVQDGVGLYEGKEKIPNYQNGHAYLTSHRVCYVDNNEPRKYSVAVDLKEIDRPEFYAGFLKSSAKITLFPKATKRWSVAIRSPVPKYASPSDGLLNATTTPPRSSPATPAPSSQVNATWICPICGLSNRVPPNFDPATANQHTPLPPCQACGVKPPLTTLSKAAIAAISNRPSASESSNLTSSSPATINPPIAGLCPRCTFQNHPSLNTCEVCGASLQQPSTPIERRFPSLAAAPARPESPGPTSTKTIIDDDTIETIKLSFRAGGERHFLERLRGALIQRKWLLQSAPPIPRPTGASSSPTNAQNNSGLNSPVEPTNRSNTPARTTVGIAGLEQRGAELRQNNQVVIGSAFEDLEALMTSAKEVIAMAEQFRKSSSGAGANTDGMSTEAQALLSDSASALGLATTKDMLGTGSAAENLYVTELSRNLAEFLTDDRRGVLRREGGIMSLVDLWAVFNRLRNGVELISPLDFEKAAVMWDTLHLPIRLRRFKSGLLVVQERSRTDEKTVASLLSWLRDGAHGRLEHLAGQGPPEFGRGVTAQEAAERFGWSLGVATEELEMAEEVGALCRDQSIDGVQFWENHFISTFDNADTRLGMTANLGASKV
ncbi:Vps36-domain-containing protein [Polychaeton citri CBS 116435]|uniref:Vacuolar protein-sorting-associated protein 36 n=1 Tax=Polychaeton citri CBS 116435 TaxID=1314669 RepID=A0A9P4QJ79_9PEZI|nr:Vps36-domain-containing protein [Polychaeton citri CBS 116435]